jgi:hypothetical protein
MGDMVTFFNSWVDEETFDRNSFSHIVQIFKTSDEGNDKRPRDFRLMRL